MRKQDKFLRLAHSNFSSMHETSDTSYHMYGCVQNLSVGKVFAHTNFVIEWMLFGDLVR